MNYLDGLLAAILANPDEDLPRLVYADELEEQDGVMDCPLEFCENGYYWRWRPSGDPNAYPHKCRICNGSGRVPNHYAARAEFIRLQIAYPQPPELDPTDYPENQRHLWAKVFPPGFFRGLEWLGSAVSDFRRGFVERVTCTAEDWSDHADAIIKSHPVREVTLTTLCGLPCRKPANCTYWIIDRWPGIKFHLPPVPDDVQRRARAIGGIYDQV